MKVSTSTVRKKAVWGQTAILTAVFATLLTVPAAAQKRAGRGHVDESVRQSVKAGESARVIMQFDTTAERDAAFNRLLDRGAAVRTMDTGGGPALNVMSSAAALSSELGNATQVSVDARVSVFAVKKAVSNPVKKTTPARAIKAITAAKKKTAPVRNGMTVAVIDSGIQPQSDLPATHIRAYVDFVSGGIKPVDKCGHGTHVAGTIAGNGAASAGEYAGVDPDVDLVVLRVLGDDCSGNTSDVIDALEWVGQNHVTYKIRVVNLSLGHPVFESAVTDPLVQAVERLSRKGIVVVTAAGNMGINPLTSQPGFGGVGVPCNAPSAVCVGALDTKGTPEFADDRVADFSSRGPSRFDLLAKPEMVADGVNVISLSAKGSKLSGNLNRLVKGSQEKRTSSYLLLSGTSMASPRVAGAAALMLTANPNLSANAVKLALQFTARVVPGVDTLAQGAGALNIGGAVQMAAIINPAATVGENWLTAALPTSNVDRNGQVVTWGNRVVYGDRFMPDDAASVRMARWDDNIVWGFDTLADNIVWGNDIVWGNCDECQNIVWGNAWDEENIVWGSWDNIVWGNNIVWGDSLLGQDVVSGTWAENVVWGFWDENVVWGNVNRSNWNDNDNIVWGNDWENIVWGNCSNARSSDDNIVWGNSDDNIVWGNNIVWGFNDGDNIVWGNCSAKGTGNGGK
ncbi:MAG: S8 family peptidase [Acidobacteriota bacterium]|nr:S8 family peptidase [Acidobacteriota bacterium]